MKYKIILMLKAKLLKLLKFQSYLNKGTKNINELHRKLITTKFTLSFQTKIKIIFQIRFTIQKFKF